LLEDLLENLAKTLADQDFLWIVDYIFCLYHTRLKWIVCHMCIYLK